MKKRKLSVNVGASLIGILVITPVHAEENSSTNPPTPTVKVVPAENGFDVMEYRVEGNNVLQAIDIERAVYPFLGERKTIKDVEAAREALEKAYHDKGYLTVLVNIPEQRVSRGVVTLNVTEAPVGRLRIVGSRYFSLGYIRDTVPALAEGSVPNFPEVQKQLAQVNRSSDRRVTPRRR